MTAVDVLGWILTGLAAWTAIAVLVGVVFGESIRRRDEQLAREIAHLRTTDQS